ncbi:hypothetical protein J9317_06665 [Metabacillus sp. KIGAM252]|uniref:Uncharacterized protein n=1 Tax=Metabacillus flavus TaxID=2823519 RepID=A0ABS5LCI5_9BACI|nr:hypothetical protein [Metabacillus flavus]MBS2968440.1 hypothetical protein [Metabacillus flavus]
MQLNFLREMTKEEFLMLLSSFLEKWVNHSSTKLMIKEMKMSLVVDGVEYDINKGGEEAVFNLFNELEEDAESSEVEVINPKRNMPKSKRKDNLIKYDSLSEWMFTKGNPFRIPLEIEKELDYIGETKPPFNRDALPVYSIESYCRTRGLVFLTKEDFKYVQKSVAAELISQDLIDKFETSAIYKSWEGLSECIKLSELEMAYNQPILKYRGNRDVGFPYVTEDNIHTILPYLNKVKPVGKQYKYFDYSFENVLFKDLYDLNQLMEENELFVITNDEYIRNHYVEYLSEHDLKTFPKEMQIKEKAVVCGSFIDNSSFNVKIKPLFKLEQILMGYSKIHEGNLKEEHLSCPIRHLPKLKKELKKENDIDFNKLIPIGLATQNKLVFEKIPVQVKEEMERYIMLKEKEDEIQILKRGFK